MLPSALEPPVDVLLKISISAPVTPKAMPSTFFEEIGSLRTMAASIIVMMGIVVVMMLALAGCR